MDAVLPALALVISIGTLLAVRGRSALIRLAADIFALFVLSLVLAQAQAGPLPTAMTSGERGWVRAVAAGWWFFACRATVSLARALLQHDERSREMRLVSDLLAAAIYLAAALAVLGLVLKLPIGGLVATSGLVAIVLGLALQSTLADVFAGIAVGVEQPFHVGDRIRLSDSIEGRVEQINWRSIRLRTDQDDLVVIPNSMIAKAQIVNRSSPSEHGIVRALLSAPAAADPDRVFELIRMATMLVPDVLPQPEPTILLLRVGERTNSYEISFTVADTARSPHVRSELLRHARRQMSANGLVPGSSADCGGRLLREAALFDGLADEQFGQLERSMKQRRIAAGELLFAQGGCEANLYFVADGVLEITRTVEGQTTVVGRLGAGDHVGEIGLLTGAPRVATATALTDARLYVIDKPLMDPILCGNEDVARALEASVMRSRNRYARSQVAVRSEEIGRPEDLLMRIVHFFSRA